MRREYVQPKLEVVDLTAFADFLLGSTESEITTPGDGDDWEDEEGNTPADPWA